MKYRSMFTRVFAPFAVAVAAIVGIADAQTLSKQVTVRIGYNPLAGGLPIVGTLMTDKLFEQEAKKMGYQVTAEWIPFLAGAPPANAAMLAGRLDIDVDFGVGAIVPRIKNKIPIVIFGINASHLSNAIVVRPGSDIDDVSKLAGKTIGLPFATSAHYTLASIVQEQTGKSLQELGVKLINMSPSEGIKMPAGLDAAAVWVPVRFMDQSLGTASLLMDSSGYSGPAHKLKGKRAPGIEKAWGYPEGYLLDRLYLCARQAFAKDYPDLLVAFLRARIQAQKLAVANRDKSLATANETWKLDTAVAAKARDTYPENTDIRNAPFALEGDALAIIKGSEFFASINAVDGPVTWADVKAVLMPGAEIQRKAWEDGGMKPSLAVMEGNFKGSNPTWPELNITGGTPVWLWDQTPNWGQRKYKAGPFLVK
jgi:ABC-type nitrate/sulfonate/bicarbonate transport system substrate-binding protein